MTKRNSSTRKPHVLDLDRQICHSLYSAANALVRAYRPVLQQLDLTYPQYLVMLSLWQQDGVSMSSLAGHTRFDAGTLTPMLKRLRDKGLIDIRVAQEDERRKEVTVTKSGRALRTAAAKIPEQILCKVDMPAEDALQLKALCETLIVKLGTDHD